jgi:RNA binding exosome subunit
VTRPIAYVSIRLSAHATEDLDKVRRACLHLFPEDQAKDVTFQTAPLKGHYGNPITLLEAKIVDNALIEALLDTLRLRLSADDKQRIAWDQSRVLEKRDLYLRLDKQAAVEGELRLRRDDPIHIRVHFKTRDRETMVNHCRELGLMP